MGIYRMNLSLGQANNIYLSSFTMLRLPSPLTLVLLLFSLWKAACAERQTLECEWDIQCEELYKPGSKCMDDGKCSNPFAAGCLYNYYMQQPNTSDDFRAPDKRICNSDDTTQENCNIFTQLKYPEIRVHNGNWESALFFSWIIQIFLSEFLHVPTTVGLSPEDTPDASFYNPRQEMSLSSQAYAFEEMVTANRMNGRCDLTNEQCVHVMPEVWPGQEKTWKSYALDGNIDQGTDSTLSVAHSCFWFITIRSQTCFSEWRRANRQNLLVHSRVYCPPFSSTNIILRNGGSSRRNGPNFQTPH